MGRIYGVIVIVVDLRGLLRIIRRIRLGLKWRWGRRIRWSRVYLGGDCYWQCTDRIKTQIRISGKLRRIIAIKYTWVYDQTNW